MKLLVLSILCSIGAMGATGGFSGDGGGRVCIAANGEQKCFVLDRYFTYERNQLPPGELITWKTEHGDRMLEILADLHGLISFLSKTKGYTQHTPEDLIYSLYQNIWTKGIRFLVTDQLSGKDPTLRFASKKEIQPEQIGYTYRFIDLTEDFKIGSRGTFDVIELKPEFFANWDRFDQLLFLTHELLHIAYPKVGHDVILPFIYHLSIVYPEYSRQQKEISVTPDCPKATCLTPVPEKVRKSMLMLHRLQHIMQGSTPTHSTVVSKKGGGLISVDNKIYGGKSLIRSLADVIYVDLSSRLNLSPKSKSRNALQKIQNRLTNRELQKKFENLYIFRSPSLQLKFDDFTNPSFDSCNNRYFWGFRPGQKMVCGREDWSHHWLSDLPKSPAYFPPHF